MEKILIYSINELLKKFHISYDIYENYMDEYYDFNLKKLNLFRNVFLGILSDSEIEIETDELMKGTFYTPENVSNLIVEKTLGNYHEKTNNLKVIDLSTGTGNLLISYIKFNKFNSDEELKSFLSNIYAYDIQFKPLIVYVNRVLMMFDEFPYDLKLEVNCENSLIKKFDEKFDIVLGNPPYIGEKGNKDLFRKAKENSFGRKYYESKMDYFYYFIYKGLEILNDNGVMGYITTNYYFTADGAVKLREFIRGNMSFLEIINFNNEKLFKEAQGQHNVVTISTHKKEINEVKIYNEKNSYEVDEENIYSMHGYIQLFSNIEDYNILENIKKSATFNLGDFFDVHQGIVTGADYLNENKSKKYKIQNGKSCEGIFVLTEDEIKQKKLMDSKYLKTFYKNSDIDHFRINKKSNKYILYIDDSEEMSKNSKEYNHLIKFKDLLDSRREVENNLRNWYALQWPRNNDIFSVEKIVVPHRNTCNKFALSENDFYASADVYYIVPRSLVFDLKVILGILNSKLMYYWMYNMGKKKGNMLELYSTPIKQIPICYKFEKEINSVVSDILKERTTENFDELNKLIYKMYNLNKKEIEIIEKHYNCMGTR